MNVDKFLLGKRSAINLEVEVVVKEGMRKK